MLEQIEANLLPHAKWEELVFYPAFKERADRDGLKTHAEAVQEHRAVELTVIPTYTRLRSTRRTSPGAPGLR